MTRPFMPLRRRFNLPSWPHSVTLAATMLLGATGAMWLGRKGLLPTAGEMVAPAPFKHGDTVAFVGDSITQNGRYLSYLRAYYLTRFPERRIRFINAGITGDTAAAARRRLAWDVLPHRPSVVSLHFGMNDVQRELYAAVNNGSAAIPGKGVINARARALADYRLNMDALAEQLADRAGAQVVFTTPTPYDEGARLEAVSLPGVNRALGQAALSLGGLARKYRGSVVDLHTPMSELNGRFQTTTPEFSIIGQDRVHPGAPGHLLIAYYYLKAQQAPALVSELAIDGDTGTIVRAFNGRLSAFEQRPGAVVFDWAEAALPFPIDEAASAALGWSAIHAELNQQMLVVFFAGEGRFRLRIDGEHVGDFSAAELRAGVNLALLPQTPQLRQAQRLLAELEQCRLQELQLRRFAQVLALLHEARVDPENRVAVDEFIAARLAAKGVNDSPYYRALFADFGPRRLTIEADAAGLQSRLENLWELNRPVVHRYELAQLAS